MRLDLLCRRAGAVLFVITSICILRVCSDAVAEEVKAVRNGAACESDESHERASPLIAQAVEHLLGEEHDTGTPEGTNKCFCGECGCG